MILVENIHVDNLVRAIYSTRNAMNSWNKSDSDLDNNILGGRDLKLAQSLVKAGTDHSKFMRMINVTMDITAPLYWWKEFDTYKVGTVANSCSTMHKIHSKEFSLDDFSHEHLLDETLTFNIIPAAIFNSLIDCLNENRRLYIETTDKKYWWQIIQLLPSSYNQKFTWTANYQILRNIYQQRRNHKLDEWKDFCRMIEELPYGKELICYNIGGNNSEV